MTLKRMGFILWTVLFLSSILYLIATYATMPDRIAVQFDLNNKPIRWQDKPGFLVWHVGFLLGLNLVFLGIQFCLSRIPESLMNVPWRSYWFSTAERKSIALSRMSTALVYTGVFINFTYLFIYHVIYQESISGAFLRVRVDLAVYSILLLLSVILVIGLFLYMKPPKREN